MSLILNRTTAPKTIRFFDMCFKRGVIDACEYGNDLDVKEFYEKKMADWSFGIIGREGEIDWQMFRYYMYWLARENSMKTLAEGYLFRIKNKNYTWCVLPFCMRFYLMGIGEWLKYPNPVGLELFKSKSRVHWDPSINSKIISRPDIISYLHQFEYEFRQAPEEVKPISDTLMSSFIQAVYDLSRKYVTG